MKNESLNWKRDRPIAKTIPPDPLGLHFISFSKSSHWKYFWHLCRKRKNSFSFWLTWTGPAQCQVSSSEMLTKQIHCMSRKGVFKFSYNATAFITDYDFLCQEERISFPSSCNCMIVFKDPFAGKTLHLSHKQGYLCSSENFGHISTTVVDSMRTADIRGSFCPLVLTSCLCTSVKVAGRQKRKAAFGPVIPLQPLKEKCQRKAEPLIGNGINERNLGSSGSYIFQREDFSWNAKGES